MTLSLAMIVKDEEEVLGRVLSCARNFCDEIVIVDTGSTDRTVEIAESFGARVFHFDWIDDFAAARNHAFAQATGDWILWLDADDVVPEASQAKILALKNAPIDPPVDTIVCNYQIAFAPDGSCLISIPRERMIRRGSAGKWEFPIHEAFIQPHDSCYVNRLDICIEHRKPAVYVERSSDRNLKMLERIISKGDRTPRMLYYLGRELKAHGRWEESIDAFRRHIEVNPDNDSYRYQAMFCIMQCAMELGRQDEALTWGFQAVQADSSRAEALTELGVLAFRRGDYARALPLLTAATVCRKPSTGMVQEEDYSWRPYHYLSLCYEGLGQFQKAIDMALQALPTIPDKDVIRDNIKCFTGKL